MTVSGLSFWRWKSHFTLFILLVSPYYLIANESAQGIEFVENKGQWESAIRYKADLSGGWLFLENDKLTYLFLEESQHGHHHGQSSLAKAQKEAPSEKGMLHGHAYQAKWLGSGMPEIVPDQSFPHYSNFFIGEHPQRWRSGVKSWAGVTYKNLYEQVDFRIYSKENSLKSDYIIKPGGRPSWIQVAYEGVDAIRLESSGNLYIRTSVNEIFEYAPYAYQVIGGEQKEVPVRYVLNGNILSYSLPEGYNEAYDLVIDPMLIFSTYSGSRSDNWGASSTYDSQGNMYLGGIARGAEYPTTIGAFQTTYGGSSGTGGCDVVITKFTADGTARLYSTYLGGRSNELLSSLYSTDKDELIALIATSSDNFPVAQNAYQKTFRGGSYVTTMDESITFPYGADIVVVKLAQDGSTLAGGTYYGGTANDGLNTAAQLNYNYGDESRSDIAVDKEGNIYIVSSTYSTNITGTTGSAQEARAGGMDGVVVKFNPDLSDVYWATYYGGRSDDAAYSIQLDRQNNVYVAGGTRSTTLPGTTNGLNSTFRGGLTDGFVAKISSDGKQVLNATYLGTSAYDQAHIIDIDKEDNIYVFGQTLGAYPVTPGVYSNNQAKQFIHKLTPDLDATVYSTVFGTPNYNYINISPTAFMVDVCGNIYAVGWGGETNQNPNRSLGYTNRMPVTPDAYKGTTDGSDFYLINLSRDAKSLMYASFFGETGSADHVDGGTSRFDKNGVVYQAVCASCSGRNGFPVTPGAYGQNNLSANCNMAGIKFRFDLQAMQIISLRATPEAACNTLTTVFSYTSTKPGTRYFWDFGDGTSSDEEFPTHTYDRPGAYTVKFILSDPDDCNPVDSAFITVNVYEPEQAAVDKVLCEEEAVEIGGRVFDQAGTYTILLQTGTGCDSTVTLTLSYLPVSRTAFTKEICFGSTYVFNGKELFQSGIYSDTLLNVQGCDSIIVLTLNVKAELITRIEKEICAGHFFEVGPERFTETGQYQVRLKTPDGCDSLVVLGLKVLDKLEATLIADICKGDIFRFNGNEYTAAGTYYTEISGTDCDTSYTIRLNVLPLPVVNISVSKNPVEKGEELELLLDADTYPGIHWEPEEVIKRNGISPAYAAITQATWFRVTITDINGCSGTDSVLVNILEPDCDAANVFIPNAFTPNGDGINDVLRVRSAFPLDDLYFIVYDRWGQKVFETAVQEQGWDGSWKNNAAAAGSYSYLLKASCNDRIIEKKGNVTLSR